jgi:hypothetical protein
MSNARIIIAQFSVLRSMIVPQELKSRALESSYVIEN